jgi:hypothetical protein
MSGTVLEVILSFVLLCLGSQFLFLPTTKGSSTPHRMYGFVSRTSGHTVRFHPKNVEERLAQKFEAVIGFDSPLEPEQ